MTVKAILSLLLLLLAGESLQAQVLPYRRRQEQQRQNQQQSLQSQVAQLHSQIVAYQQQIAAMLAARGQAAPTTPAPIYLMVVGQPGSQPQVYRLGQDAAPVPIPAPAPAPAPAPRIGERIDQAPPPAVVGPPTGYQRYSRALYPYPRVKEIP